MRLAIGVASLAAVAALSACKDKGRAGGEDYAPSASSPPPIEIVTAMGGCDDIGICQRECDAGSGDRCRRLAVSYEFGRGVAKDEKTATAFFDHSCELGNAPGCVSAGQMHEYAHGVPKDDALAAKAYERACTIGWQVGCANFAIMLENGRGLPKDVDRARGLFESACKAGAGLACERAKALGRDGG